MSRTADQETINKIAEIIDIALNMRMKEKAWGYCLLAVPVGRGVGDATCITNLKTVQLKQLLTDALADAQEKLDASTPVQPSTQETTPTKP